MNHKRLEVLFGVLTIVVAFFAWMSIRNAIIVPDSSTWAVPMMFFSLYVVFICLDVIVFKDILLLELLVIASSALSLIFAFDWLQLIAILLGAYFLFLASRKIRGDMELNIKISIWKSLQAGKTYLLFAVALLITMQYFVIVRDFDGEKKVPHFDASFVTKEIAIPFISSVSPQFEVLKDETLTVDQFILQTQNSKQGNDFFAANDELLEDQIPTNLTPAQKEMIKKQVRENFSNTQAQVSQKNQELILAVGRKQLSDMVGEPVNGNEKISEVFTGLINSKVNNYFNPNVQGVEKNSALPMIMAIVLFLTIYPISLIFSMLCFLIVKMVIISLINAGVLSVNMETVTKEVLG